VSWLYLVRRPVSRSVLANSVRTTGPRFCWMLIPATSPGTSSGATSNDSMTTVPAELKTGGKQSARGPHCSKASHDSS